MKPILVYADGRTEENEYACAMFVRHGDHWFRLAGHAVDRNTTHDGQQLTYAIGPPNNGRAVYLEIVEPCFSPVRVVEV